MRRRLQYPSQSKVIVITAATPVATPDSLVFSTFSQPSPSNHFLTHLQLQPSFEVNQPPQQKLVFTTFSQPAPISKLAVHLHTQPIFEIGFLGPASTPDRMVFSPFEQPYFHSVRIEQQPNVIFRILKPDTATPDIEVFSPYEQPLFNKNSAYQQSGVSYSPQPFSVVVPFNGFSEFGFTQSKYAKQLDQSFVFAPQFQPYVFSVFGTPSLVRFKDDSKVNFEIGFLGPAQTPIWSVFSTFKELYPKKPQQDPSVGFIGDLGSAQVPPWFVFGPFEQPRPPVGLVDTQQFTLFEIIPATQTTPVFIAFDQPYNYSSFKEGQINFKAITSPVLISPTQVFIPFDQPYPVKSSKDGQVYFALGTIIPAAQTPSSLIFSTFDQPKFNTNTYNIREGQLIIDQIFIPSPPPPTDVEFHALPFLITLGPITAR